MKIDKHILAIVAVSLLALSCNSSSNNQETGSMQNIESHLEEKTNEALGEIKGKVTDLKNEINNLASTDAIAREVLKAVFPDELGGLRQAKLEIEDASLKNFSKIEATYENAGDPRKIDLKITDGAGEKGSLLLNELKNEMSLLQKNANQNTEERLISIANRQAIVKERTALNDLEAEVKYIHGDRFIIEVDGDGYSLLELQDLLNKIDVSALR